MININETLDRDQKDTKSSPNNPYAAIFLSKILITHFYLPSIIHICRSLAIQSNGFWVFSFLKGILHRFLRDKAEVMRIDKT